MSQFPLSAHFRADAVSAETLRVNEALSARMAASAPPADLNEFRARFARGESAIPVSPRSPRAQTATVPGPTGDVGLRIVPSDAPAAVYLHIHGGGWMLGTNDMADGQLERLAETAGCACVSVEYRLAPENPYPAAVDDCEAAVLWLLENAEARFGTTRLLIGGESAGAHLAVLTLIRLRERGLAGAFEGASLMFGFYDLALTPSARRAENTPVLDRDMLAGMAAAFRGAMDVDDPSVSPFYADLSDLPPALFSVGTFDPLLDDSLFMHMRWLAAGNRSELALYPGGLHGFTALEGELARAANERANEFLAEIVDACAAPIPPE